MRIDYQLTEDDIVAFSQYLLQHQSTVLQAYRRGLLAAVGLLMATAVFMIVWGQAAAVDQILALAPVPIVVLLLFFISSRKRFAKCVRDAFRRGDYGKRALERQRLEITPEGYTQTSELGAGTTLWKGVEKIVVTKGHLFIFLSKNSAVVAPAHAFADEWEFADFAQTAQRYHDAAVQADQTC